jgi:hypothetical protein
LQNAVLLWLRKNSEEMGLFLGRRKNNRLCKRTGDPKMITHKHEENYRC